MSYGAKVENIRLRETVAYLTAALRGLVEHDEYMVKQKLMRPYVELERARIALDGSECKP